MKRLPDTVASAVIGGAITNRVKTTRLKRCCGTPHGEAHRIGCSLVMEREARAAATPAPAEAVTMPKMPRSGKKYSHFKIICISMYSIDLAELDAKIERLKARGWSKANKSQLIRMALAMLDVEKMPIPRM